MLLQDAGVSQHQCGTYTFFVKMAWPQQGGHIEGTTLPREVSRQSGVTHKQSILNASAIFFLSLVPCVAKFSWNAILASAFQRMKQQHIWLRTCIAKISWILLMACPGAKMHARLYIISPKISGSSNSFPRSSPLFHGCFPAVENAVRQNASWPLEFGRGALVERVYSNTHVSWATYNVLKSFS